MSTILIIVVVLLGWAAVAATMVTIAMAGPASAAFLPWS